MSGKGEKKRRRALDAYSRLQRAAAMSATRVEAAVQSFGLSASQFGVLDTLQTRGSVHQQELAEALGRSKAQMTAIIDALEEKALVRRERHATDRRYITVHLTPQGQATLASATPVRSAAIVELMSELTGEQRARLARLCRRLLRVLDPYDDTGDTTDDAASDAASAPVAPAPVAAPIVKPHSASSHDAPRNAAPTDATSVAAPDPSVTAPTDDSTDGAAATAEPAGSSSPS